MCCLSAKCERKTSRRIHIATRREVSIQERTGPHPKTEKQRTRFILTLRRYCFKNSEFDSAPKRSGDAMGHFFFFVRLIRTQMTHLIQTTQCPIWPTWPIWPIWPTWPIWPSMSHMTHATGTLAGESHYCCDSLWRQLWAFTPRISPS